MNRLKEYETVRFWIGKASGSEVTEKVYVNRFQNFLEHYHANPNEIVEEWKKVKYDWREREKFLDHWSERIESYYVSLEGVPLGKRASITPVLSFFKHHKIPVDVEFNKHVYVKYPNRDIKKQEIRRILENVGIRERSFFLIMVESGLRPRTIVQLKYKHIKEDFESERVPMKISVPAELAKDRVGHRFTFIGSDGYHALKEYLLPKLPLDDEDRLFVANKREKNVYLSPETFSKIFSKTVLKLKLEKRTEAYKPKPLRMYCLRKYFRNNIRVDMAFREFWMGHKWGTDEHYLTRDEETHRGEYAKAYASIRVAPQEVTVTPEMYEQLRKENETLRKEVEDLKKRLSKESIIKILQELAEQKVYLVTKKGEKEIK